MEKQDLAILYSGGRYSLALYALALAGHHPKIPRPYSIHLLHMLNGMGSFHSFPQQRFHLARGLLLKQLPDPESAPETYSVELDMRRLLQGLWLDRYEELMPRFGGKNMVCVACKLGMYAKAVLYCITHHVPLLLAGYAPNQCCCPEQGGGFMERISAFSALFGITTVFPLFDEIDDEYSVSYLLEEFGLPSSGGGERQCLFSQTLTTADEEEVGDYMDAMIPRLAEYLESKLAGRVREAAACFPFGNCKTLRGQDEGARNENIC